jgi:hypothetical protein
MLIFNVILHMLKKLLLLSVMPFGVYAMDGDGQADAVNRDTLSFSSVPANGATIVTQDGQNDTTAETLHQPTDTPAEITPQAAVQVIVEQAADTSANDDSSAKLILPTPAPLVEPHEPTLNDIAQLIQNAYDANNLIEANTVITQYTKTLMASKEGIALGLRAAITLGVNVNFYKLMRVENAAFKPDSDTIDRLLITAATCGRSHHAESLFQYRYGVPTPSMKAINDAIIAAAANGYPAFIELLHEVSTRPSSEIFDWITKPNLKQMSLILSPYICAAYMYYYASGYSTIPNQENGYHYTALTHFMRDFFIMNACIFASKILIKPLIAKYCYNYKFAAIFNSETMDKALLSATVNGQIDTVRWLLQDRSTVGLGSHRLYTNMPRPTHEGEMKALFNTCFRPGIKNRLPILDKLLTEITSFIKKGLYQKAKADLDKFKLTLLLGTYILEDVACSDRLRAENLPISQEFIDGEFERSLSVGDDTSMLFLAPNLPMDLRVSRDKVIAALDVPRIKSNPSFVNMIRLYLNPTPLMPFNNWIAALDMSKESDDASLTKDMQQTLKEILPPPSVSLRELLTNIFANLYHFTE